MSKRRLNEAHQPLLRPEVLLERWFSAAAVGWANIGED
jgi:hypothetical protein